MREKMYKNSLKRILACSMAAFVFASAVGCGNSSDADDGEFKVAMLTDTGGVNDQSFNTSAWEGLQEFSQNTGAKVNYLESTQATDYPTNLDKLADQGYDLIWGIGYALTDSLKDAAIANPDLKYAIADSSYGDDTPENITGVMFRAQESAFIVGYIAGKTTKTNMVGFIGGMKSAIIDQFEYGFTAGVKYAAKELGKDIKVSVQYIESFTDATKGKATASKMLTDGCDIVFHATGGAGVGVIEACKEANKFAIGVDRDQSYLAEKNVLTSALKMVNTAVALVSTEVMNGKDLGGQTLTYGLKENCVGIPKNNPNMEPEVYEDAIALEQKIIDGEITPPEDEQSYQTFISELNK